MTNFKHKKVYNKKKDDVIVTLDKKHKDYLIDIDNKSDNESKIRNKIDVYRKEIDDFSNKLVLTSKEKDRKIELMEELIILEDNLNNIENNIDEMNYYNKVSDILIDYQKINTNKNVFSKNINILDLLKKKNNKEDINNNKTNLYNKYCKFVDGDIIDKTVNRIKICNICNIEKILDNNISCFVCPQCGDSEIVIINEEIQDYSPYKRINRFKECINLFQAKENIFIEEEIFINITEELNKLKLKNIKDINYKMIKSILKKLGHNNLYDHITFIINKITGLPPPTITREIEELFLDMFLQIQEPWELYKEPGRQNFLSYSYVLYKFSELHSLYYLLPCFKLPKSDSVLRKHDRTWKKICDHRKWEYIPTI